MSRRWGIAASALAAAWAIVAASAGAETFVVTGSCRDGVPHGAYELRTAAGKLRAIGAFNLGRRTGSFIFWTDAGARIAHVPYDEGTVNGTAALWYASPVKGSAGPQQLEAAYAGGRRNGSVRSWYVDGRPRVEAEFEDGRLVSVHGFDPRGRPLPEAEARGLAEDADLGKSQGFRSLDALVQSHLPVCRNGGDGDRRP